MPIGLSFSVVVNGMVFCDEHCRLYNVCYVMQCYCGGPGVVYHVLLCYFGDPGVVCELLWRSRCGLPRVYSCGTVR